MTLALRVPTVSCSFPLRHSPFFPYQKPIKMALNLNKNNKSSSTTASFTTIAESHNRKLPVLLFDVMDTIVRDPFYHDVPAFFRMSLKELIECKHPTAWIEFEKGIIDEVELTRKFFKDGRSFDLEGWSHSSVIAGLKDCMRRGYSYIEGIEELLRALKQNSYEIHAFTNYPFWYKIIEDKLKISRYLSWTFCSCTIGKRKPDPDSYLEVLSHLKADPANCIFIDDRLRNVEAAVEVGIVGLHFKNADLLCKDLSLMGIDISVDEHHKSQDQPKLAEEHSS